MGPDHIGRTWAQPAQRLGSESIEDPLPCGSLEPLAEFPQEELGHRHAFDRRSGLESPAELAGHIADSDRYQ
jgi:hypothetical protein